MLFYWLKRIDNPSALAPHLRTAPYLVLFDRDGLPLQQIIMFNSDTMEAVRKDDTAVAVYRYGWYCPDRVSYELCLLSLPADQHLRVQLQQGCIAQPGNPAT